MKPIYTLYIYIIFTFLTIAKTRAQEYTIHFEIQPKDSLNILNNTVKNSRYLNESDVKFAVDSIANSLALKGYINTTYNLTKNDTIYNCTFFLNNQVTCFKVIYQHSDLTDELIKDFNLKTAHNIIHIPTSKVSILLTNISYYLEEKGFSFSKVSLKNLKEENQCIMAQLVIETNSKRTIDKTIIKGYDNFPKKYVKNYLGISDKILFNKKVLNTVSNKINSIPFVSQIKEPEVLFTKDSTQIYLYLKKKSLNQFDGIIGFSNEQNGALKLNGYLNLNLLNIFNKGEQIGLNWQNTSLQHKILKLSFTTPYIYNSKISFGSNFSIFTQDSTFTNTQLNLKFNYALFQKANMNLILTSEKSSLTTQVINNNFQSYTKKIIGLNFEYQTPNTSLKKRNQQFSLESGYSVGQRVIDSEKNYQSNLLLIATYRYILNSKNNFLLKTVNQAIFSKNYVPNELYRIGGANLLRGFDELSIVTPRFSVNTFEYHYNLNKANSVYSITDVAFLKNEILNQQNNLYGIGLGFDTKTSNSIITLNYVIGNNMNTSFKFSNSKVHIKIAYLF